MNGISNDISDACFVGFSSSVQFPEPAETKAAAIIQKHIRGQLARGPFLPRNLLYRDCLALCKKAEGPESKSMPQAPAGKTKVYLPEEMPEVVLKCLGKDSAIKRFAQMGEARSFLNSQKSSHLIIPRAKLCGNFLVEQRLPVNIDTYHNIELYLLQTRLFDEPVRELVRLFSKRYIRGLINPKGKCHIRYDNLPFYIVEKNGKKEARIGLIDLEGFRDDPKPHGLNNLVSIFPLHLDLIKKEANFLKMDVDDEPLVMAKIIGIKWFAVAGWESWGEQFYSGFDRSRWPAILYVDLIFRGNPSQKEEIEGLVSCASDVSCKDPEYAIYIYKKLIAHNPRQFEAYIALCTLLEDPAERLSLFSKAAKYAEEDGNLELASNFRRYAERPLYQAISQEDLAQLAEGESPVYPTSMSEEDWIHPAVFLKKIPPMPQALVDFLEGPCPNDERKQAKYTHIVAPFTKNLTRIVDGNCVTLPRTVGSLHKLNKDSGGPGCINLYDLDGRDKPSEIEFEWAVMTKEVLPGSKGEDHDTQQRLLEEKGYQMPGILEAVTCIFWEHRRSGSYFYNRSAYTRCHESFYEGFHSAVGGCSGEGLYVKLSFEGYDVGVAGIRKFPVSP